MFLVRERLCESPALTRCSVHTRVRCFGYSFTCDSSLLRYDRICSADRDWPLLDVVLRGEIIPQC